MAKRKFPRNQVPKNSLGMRRYVAMIRKKIPRSKYKVGKHKPDYAFGLVQQRLQYEANRLADVEEERNSKQDIAVDVVEGPEDGQDIAEEE